jgi:hypothetical protein
MHWLLLAAALAHIPCDPEFFDLFRPIFWNPGPNMQRIMCRVMFVVLNSDKIAVDVLETILSELLRSVGSAILEFKDGPLATANEITWILRRILVEKSRAAPHLLRVLLDTPRNDQILVCGLFAVLGSIVEAVRPYCNVKYHDKRSDGLDYIAVPTEHQDSFLCYRRPFVLSEPAQRIKVTPGVLIYPVSMVSLTPEVFGDFNFILSFFDDCFADLGSVRSALYVQVLAHYLKFPGFVEMFTPEMCTKLARFPLPCHLIPSTLVIAKQTHALEIVPPVCGFNAVSSGPTA